MGRRRPKVSIGVNVRNGMPLLEEAIESLVTQTFEDLEIVIGDNASTDATEEVCRRYADEDRRIRYVRHDRDFGATKNFNFVALESRGRYFKWASHDDVCEPEFVERCVAHLDDASEGVVLCFPQTTLIDGEGEVIGPYNRNVDLRASTPAQRLRDYVSQVSLCNEVFGLIRADALRRTQMLGNYASADVVLLAELALLGEFHELPGRLFLRRFHPGMSRRANVTPLAVARWFDTRNGRPILSEPNRLIVEHVRGILVSEIPLGAKLACLGVFASALLHRRLGVAGRSLREKPEDVARAARHEEEQPACAEGAVS